MANFVDRLKLLREVGYIINMYYTLYILYVFFVTAFGIYMLYLLGTEKISLLVMCAFFAVFMASLGLGSMIQYLLDLHHRSYDVVSEYIEKSLNRQYEI